jgi:hypothetical protein
MLFMLYIIGCRLRHSGYGNVEDETEEGEIP